MTRSRLRTASELRALAEVTAAAWADPALSVEARCCLLALAGTAASAGRLDVLPSASRLARGCGLTAAAARRVVGSLRRAGWLTVSPSASPAPAAPLAHAATC